MGTYSFVEGTFIVRWKDKKGRKHTASGQMSTVKKYGGDVVYELAMGLIGRIQNMYPEAEIYGWIDLWQDRDLEEYFDRMIISESKRVACFAPIVGTPDRYWEPSNAVDCSNSLLWEMSKCERKADREESQTEPKNKKSRKNPEPEEEEEDSVEDGADE